MDWYHTECRNLKIDLHNNGFDFENNEIEALVLMGLTAKAKIAGFDNEANVIGTMINKVLEERK